MGQNRPLPSKFSKLSGIPGLAHGYFSRQGGVSSPPWEGLNIGLNTGDDPNHVAENRQRLLDSLGVSRGFFVNQTHGTGVLCLKADGPGAGDFWEPGVKKPIHTADAMVTNIPDMALVIQVADCQAVILVDPVRRVIANVHSGWRGSVANILGKTVKTMVAVFGGRPEDIIAGVSPSLGPCCAEFVNYRDEIPRTIWKYRKNNCYFDFWALSEDQLKNAGIAHENIEIAGRCTRCEYDRYFSYRKQAVTGRLGVGVAWL